MKEEKSELLKYNKQFKFTWSNLLTMLIVLCTLVNLLLLTVGIYYFWSYECSTAPKKQSLFVGGQSKIRTTDQVFDFENKKFKIYASESTTKILRGSFGKRIDFENDYNTIVINNKLDQNRYASVKFFAKSRAADIEFTIEKKESAENDEVTCDSYQWKILNNVNDYAFQEFEECFELDKFSWYGQAEYHTQYWPINNISYGQEFKPYLTGKIDYWGSILERYWLSTSGIAIVVDQDVPLFLLKNKTSICLLASSKEPYDEHKIVFLKYDICKIDAQKSRSDYLNKLHLYMINKYFAKPSGIPDKRMFKSPIWSTWAYYKKNINQTMVMQFAKEILANNYSNSQIEIDDMWQTKYGDFEFKRDKFPNIKDLILNLNDLGFRTTLWIHPFTNLDSENFFKVIQNNYNVRGLDGSDIGLTFWWDGINAVIIDPTNPNASDWFVAHLEKIRNESKIDSFKFDAGEVMWLPKKFTLYNNSITPNQYSIEYARMANRLGNMIEVRVGCQTQNLPIFVRMLDKDSNWGYDNGLKSVLTTALVMSILGYPFILPDMIGGNAYFYKNGTVNPEFNAYPNYELYVRWAQMTVFMPSMQYSIPPWYYNDKTQVPVNKICKEYTDLHENLVYPLLIKYATIATQTAEPIIRPLWWLDNADLINQQSSDEFLVGNEILVAPITEKNTYQRDIYLPRGNWRAEDGTQFAGPLWLRNYPAPIEKIPYFIAF